MDLTVQSRASGDALILTIAGDVDSYSAPELARAFDEAIDSGRGPVIVDLTAVTFLNSAGLGALVATHKRLLSASRAMRLVCTDERIIRLLEITDLTEVFPIDASIDAALAEAAR